MSNHWDGPGIDAWAAWTPQQVALRLADIGIPWMVVGGHAIDLWLGRLTRAHDDLEIEIPRGDFPQVRARFDDCDSHSVGDGNVHRLAAQQPPLQAHHQVWLLDRAAQQWRLDVMLSGSDDTWWRYRRDPRVVRPLRDIIRSRDGVPYLAPECVLLYKAKAQRPKDEADFSAVVPTLDDGARQWLRSHLEPQHAWSARL